MSELGWKARIPLSEGLNSIFEKFDTSQGIPERT
jgi:hypothetical protein